MAKKKAKPDNTLINVFSEMARRQSPGYESKMMVGDKELLVAVYPGDYSVTFNLTSAKGGKGVTITVPNSAIKSVAAYLTSIDQENSRIFERSTLI